MALPSLSGLLEPWWPWLPPGCLLGVLGAPWEPLGSLLGASWVPSGCLWETPGCLQMLPRVQMPP